MLKFNIRFHPHPVWQQCSAMHYSVVMVHLKSFTVVIFTEIWFYTIFYYSIIYTHTHTHSQLDRLCATTFLACWCNQVELQKQFAISSCIRLQTCSILRTTSSLMKCTNWPRLQQNTETKLYIIRSQCRQCKAKSIKFISISSVVLKRQTSAVLTCYSCQQVKSYFMCIWASINRHSAAFKHGSTASTNTNSACWVVAK